MRADGTPKPYHCLTFLQYPRDVGKNPRQQGNRPEIPKPQTLARKGLTEKKRWYSPNIGSLSSLASISMFSRVGLRKTTACTGI